MIKKRKAFTFAELMIAVLILSGTLGTIVYSYMVFMNMSKLSKNVSLASRVAAAKLEEIKSSGFNNVAGFSNQVFFPNATAQPQDLAFQDFNYRGIVYVDVISATLYQVTAVICWQQGDRTIGPAWVFGATPSPGANARVTTPVVVTTLISSRNP